MCLRLHTEEAVKRYLKMSRAGTSANCTPETAEAAEAPSEAALKERQDLRKAAVSSFALNALSDKVLADASGCLAQAARRAGVSSLSIEAAPDPTVASVSRRQLPGLITALRELFSNELLFERVVRFVEVRGFFPGLATSDKLSLFDVMVSGKG